MNQCARQQSGNWNRGWPASLVPSFRGRILSRGYGVLPRRRQCNRWVKLGSVRSQLNQLSLLRLVMNQKWHCFINGLCCPTSPKGQRGYTETKVTSEGTALGGAALIWLKKKWWGKWLIQEDTAITSQWRTGSEDSRGIHCSALNPSESVRAGQRKENWKSVPPSD